METFNLGQKILAEHSLERKEKYVDTIHSYKKRNKLWEKAKFKEPKEVIVIGVRTLSNGETHYDSDAGYMYNPKEHFKALLVVETLRSAPFYIEYPKEK